MFHSPWELSLRAGEIYCSERKKEKLVGPLEVKILLEYGEMCMLNGAGRSITLRALSEWP